mmetsp:Transcript_72323/g.182403  ORF Transcript_72323/g.182403 Transcript_72323/m.182403 type:complete len:632 (+) Transcript_72323:109-2004(+)
MGGSQVHKLLTIFLAVGFLTCIAVRDEEPIESDTPPKKYNGDVFLTLYKDNDCSMFRYHHRIRPGLCVKTNTDQGKKRGFRAVGYKMRIFSEPYNHAWLSETGELYMCKEKCELKEDCMPVSWEENGQCLQPDMTVGAHIRGVRVGYPQVSLQYFSTPECVHWFDKRDAQIWQHDVFFDDCFKTEFPTTRDNLHYAKIDKSLNSYFCEDKFCNSCNQGPLDYTESLCVDAFYVGIPKDHKQKMIRIQNYDKTEASTVLDDPECQERVDAIHSAMDVIKQAQKSVETFIMLDQSCRTPKQNMDLRALFGPFEEALFRNAENRWPRWDMPSVYSALQESPQEPVASLVDVQSSEDAESIDPYFLVTSYKDKECFQMRDHVKVTYKCTPLAPKGKGRRQFAVIKQRKLLICDDQDCVGCFDPEDNLDPDGDPKACRITAGNNDYIKAVRIGKPEYSVQFHSDASCPNWHDKRSALIWQHDMFMNNCFETAAPIIRNDLHYALLTEKQGKVILKTCSDKACNPEDCQETPYLFDECEDANYIGKPKEALQKYIRIKKWEEDEAATIYDEFPECVERVAMAHKAMDDVKAATMQVDVANSAEHVCDSPKQDMDMFQLGKKLRSWLTGLRPNTGMRW